jgi:hypothetical protein
MTSTTQSTSKVTIQDGQETNAMCTASNAAKATIPEAVENIRLLISVFDSLNALENKLSKLDHVLDNISQGKKTGANAGKTPEPP